MIDHEELYAIGKVHGGVNPEESKSKGAPKGEKMATSG